MREDDIFHFPRHMAIRPLTVSDLDQVLELENTGFPPNERCSKEKLHYRLTVCPELSSGVFVREFESRYDETKDHDEDDEEEDKLPEKSSIVKETLIGLLIGTRIYGAKIRDESMQIPELTHENLPKDPKTTIGHIESSRVIGIHSLVIHPDWRGKKLASLLLNDYIQKLSNQDVGDSVTLLSKEALVPFYLKNNFSNDGKSACTFADEQWFDLSVDLVANDDE